LFDGAFFPKIVEGTMVGTMIAPAVVAIDDFKNVLLCICYLLKV
jgi:hypothetical protein